MHVDSQRSLMAHLLRRAGFGATPSELDAYCAWGYEETVEWLLYPEDRPTLEEDIIERYYIDWKESRNIEGALTETVYRMNCNAGARPLQEKIALFWHGVFATGLAKVLHEKTMLTSDRHVPAVRSGQFPGVAAPFGPRPGYDFLAGQQFQS